MNATITYVMSLVISTNLKRHTTSDIYVNTSYKRCSKSPNVFRGQQQRYLSAVKLHFHQTRENG